MKYLFGVFFRSERNVASVKVSSLLYQMADIGGENIVTWYDNCCGFGQFAYIGSNTSDKWNVCVPIIDTDRKVSIICSARLDNRAEIGAAIGLSTVELAKVSDSEIVRRAYYNWGERCVERLYGDWSFAAWHPDECRLFLARDHFGITSLYYYSDQNIFAFASTRESLLALKLVPIKMDELYLAQILTSWQSYDGHRTIYSGICRFPPAHCMTITPVSLNIKQYWYLENTPLLNLPRRNDYVEAFRELFDEAVKVRLRVEDAPNDVGTAELIASCLSGGLDSSSVTATAANFLKNDGGRIAAYTSVPLYETSCYVNARFFGNEFPQASATARFSGNIDINVIDSANYTPIQAIRKKLQITNEPAHGAGNLFWLVDLRKTVQNHGKKVLLIGACGNPGASWQGDVFSQSIIFQISKLGLRKWAKDTLKRNLPSSMLAAWRSYRVNPHLYYRSSAINLAFADRLNLFERWNSDPGEQLPRTALELRSFLQPGRSAFGSIQAELAAAFGLQVRDPTADARLLAFTFSVPDHIFIDPKTGMDRWLIRETMKGRLPEEVRLNRNRGRQAADLVPRLRASASEVEATLSELAKGPAAEYVDVPYMWEVWQMIQTKDTPEAYIKSVAVLTRGIMAGLFVNDFYK